MRLAEVGRPLPRAAEAYAEDAKWHEYILGDDGHGAEWRTVFRVDPSQAQALWNRVAAASINAPVTEIRPSRFGATRVELTFNGRRATVLLGWFSDHPGDAPRLVTAYPAP